MVEVDGDAPDHPCRAILASATTLENKDFTVDDKFLSCGWKYYGELQLTFHGYLFISVFARYTRELIFKTEFARGIQQDRISQTVHKSFKLTESWINNHSYGITEKSMPTLVSPK